MYTLSVGRKVRVESTAHKSHRVNGTIKPTPSHDDGMSDQPNEVYLTSLS